MATSPTARTVGQDIPVLIGFFAVVLVAGMLAAWANAGDVEDWYRTLAKPEWTPPDSWFGPVWTALYILMAVAAWLVWRKHDYPGRGGAMALFFIQLALNVLWPVVFFAWHLIGWSLAEIVVLWVLVLATTFAFWQISTAAGVLMLPYLLWTTFAAALNASIWTLNHPAT